MVPRSMSGSCREIVGVLGRLGLPFGSVLSSILALFFDDFCIDVFTDFGDGFRLHFG